MLNITLRRLTPRLLPLAFCAISLWGESAPVLLPIGKDRLVQALQYRVLTTDQLLERISSRGVDFEMSDEDWKELTRRGASSRIISAVRANYRPTGSKEAQEVNASLAEAQIYSGPPLMQREIELMLQMKVPMDKVSKAVAARGVEFALTPSFVQKTFDLGGNLVFLGEMLLNNRSQTPPPPPEVLFAAAQSGKPGASVAKAPPPPPAPAPKPQPVLVASAVPVPPPAVPTPAPVQAAAVAPPPVSTPKPVVVTPPPVKTEVVIAPTKPVLPPPPAATPAPSPSTSGASAGRVVVEPALQQTKLLHQTPPVYPTEARAMRLSGTVRLELLIGADGVVKGTKVIEGHPMLAGAATNAVRNWTYRPTLIDAQAVEVVTTIEIRFHP